MDDDNTTIHLKILSPSTEVEGGINFTDLPTTTTIKELRSRIQDAVPSRPVPERMRLIYRGRVVANEADTLGNVFGADNLRQSKDQSLHLVLRELPPSSTASSSPAPRSSSTAPPNPFRPAQAPVPASPPLQTNPFRTLPRPNSQPQVPPPHPPHHHHHPHVHHHVVQGPFQIPLPPAIQQQMAQAMNMAQNGQVNPGQAPDAQGQRPQEGTPAPQNGAPGPPTGLPPLPGFAPRPNPPNNGQTVRQEGIGPNGERWTVTYNSTMQVPIIPGQIPNLPRPFQQPLGFGLPPRPTGSPAPAEAVDRLLPRMRFILQSARQDMENVNTLLQASAEQAAQPSMSPPLWRLERVRQHVQLMGQNLGLVERGLGVIAADASMTDNPDVVSLRTEAQSLRERLEEFNTTLNQQGNLPAAPAPQTGAVPSASQLAAFTNSSTPPSTSQPQTQTASQTLPPGTPEELFILSSPQGPVGLLFDQRGTYMTAPFVPTLPFQTFTNQFAQNRQLIAGMGQQIAHGSSNLHNQLANIRPTPTQRPNPTGQPQPPNQPEAQAGNQGQAQAQVQAQAQNPNPPVNPQADVPGMGNMGHHLWTLLKIACFVYFFSGGGGWYKSLMLGLVAGGVYLAQLGMFEEHFAVIRQFFEGVLPAGAFPERLGQPRNANAIPQPQPGRNLTPEEAARRILQQRRDDRFGWVRDGVRTVERAVSLFLASLWPGIGERMVHAQEERERLERVAESERREAEEERLRQEAEAAEKKGEGVGEADQGSSMSAKGKERADVVEGAGNAVDAGASS